MKAPIQRILVPLDPSVFTAAATETACLIAKKHKSVVAGVAVLDSHEIRSSLVPAMGPYYPMMIDAVHAKVKHADHILEECKNRFAHTCETAGITHTETEYEGVPAEKLLESSIFFDLVITGHETAFHFETRGEQGECLSEILDKAVTPILAVPAEGMEKLESVLVCFDGSLSSARALHDFILFAAPFNLKVKVLVADTEKEKAEFLLRSATELLQSHGIENVETIASDLPVDAAVDEGVVADVDLIVAGIHSRKPIKDFFVGSFTKELLSRGTKPLLISH